MTFDEKPTSPATNKLRDTVTMGHARRMFWQKWLKMVPAIIMAGAIGMSVLLVSENKEHRRELARSVRAENEQKMAATKEHIEEYFALLYTTLYYVSADDRVIAMKNINEEYIFKQFALQWSFHNMAEMYILRSDFDGTHLPMLTFEIGESEKEADSMHSLEREQEEYYYQQEHIAKFAADSSLSALISPQIELCVDSKGIVYSVPIRSDTGLVGIVSGMASLSSISAQLGKGNYGNMAVLVNEHNEIIGCNDLPDDDRNWFVRQLEAKGAASFFSDFSNPTLAGRWTTMVVPANIELSQKWWLAFQYDEVALMRPYNWIESWFAPFILIAFGLVLSLLVEVNRRRYLQALRHIDDQMQIEGRLRELAAFPENNPNLVISLAASGKLVYANAATRAVLREIGQTLRGVLKLMPEDTGSIITQALAENKTVSGIECSHRGQFLLWAFHPVREHNLVHCYGSDITEQVQRQLELKRLSMAVKQSGNMTYIMNPEGIIEYANPEYLRVSGCKAADVIGQKAPQLNSKQYESESGEPPWAAIREGRVWKGVVRHQRLDGDTYWARLTVTPVLNDRGLLTNFLAVGDDITNELKTQQRLVEADKLKAVGTLAAGVAHEFKNYLCGIIGNASFGLDELQTGKSQEVLHDVLTQIVELGDKANDIAMSLLTYSRTSQEEFARENLQEIVERSIKLVEKSFGEKSIDIVTHYDAVPELRVSAGKIQQLLVNLLINAEHAIGTQGVITVFILRHDESVLIRVGDTGRGISTESISKVFDPFFSTKGVWGKDEVVGTGMGLSICRNIAREHGGDLTVESSVGHGTTFTMTLPIPNDDEKRIVDQAMGTNTKMVLFTANDTLQANYREQAKGSRVEVIAVDNIDGVTGDMQAMADLVVIDAKFPGKAEIWRLTEMCILGKVPYMMINCGVVEYQLADLVHNATADFKDKPSLLELLSKILIEDVKPISA